LFFYATLRSIQVWQILTMNGDRDLDYLDFGDDSDNEQVDR